MKLTIVTPEKPVYDDEITQVTLPTPQGEITVLEHHMPLVTEINPGELAIIHKNGKREYYATGGGFAQITGYQVSVLTDLAQHAAAINEQEVEAARKRAQDTLTRRHELSDEEIAATESALLKSLAQLKVRHRYHGRTMTTETVS